MSSHAGAEGTADSFSHKVRGTVGVVQGVGDNIRGGVMEFLDSATETAQRSEGKVATKGAQRTEDGGERMKHGGSTSQGNDPASDVVTVQDIHSQRAAGNHRYGAPTEGASGGI